MGSRYLKGVGAALVVVALAALAAGCARATRGGESALDDPALVDATLLVPLRVSAPTPARKHKDRTQRATRSLILRLPVGVNMLLVFRTSKEVPQPPMQTHVQRLHDLATSDLIESRAFFATVAYLLESWGGLLTLPCLVLKICGRWPRFPSSFVVHTRDDTLCE